MEYEECRLTLKKDEQGAPVVEYWDSFYSGTKGKVRHDSLTKKTVQRFMRWVAENDDRCTREDLQVLGLHLYHILFDDNLRDFFDNTYQKFKKRRENNPDLSLRLKLTFHKDFQDLAMYPWEFIYMPSDMEGMTGEFLAKTTELILTRFVAEPESRDIDKLYTGEGPIRILIVSSHPRRSEGRQLDIIDGERFVQKISELHTDKLIIEYLKNPTFKALRQKIHGNQSEDIAPFHPHIFHFIGHGKPGKIALVKNRDELEILAIQQGRDVSELDDAHWIDGETLSTLFPDPKPRFVFLNACSGAKAEYMGFNEIANSIARDLVCSDIPAVVAMQYEIKNDDANSFAQKVYNQLNLGQPIDKAVKQGIMELGEYPPPSWNHPRFGTPVFYLQAKDTTFLPKIPDSGEISVPSNRESIQWEDCPHCRKIKVSSKYKSCPICRKPLIQCPECDKPISPEYAICPFCTFELQTSLLSGTDMKVSREARVKKQDLSKERIKEGKIPGRSPLASNRSN